MKIPLFDIDGTLFTANSQVGYEAFSYAVKKTYGIEATPHEINSQGMIDNQITVDVLKHHGLTTEEVRQKIDAQNKAVVEYGRIHKKEIHPAVLPGARELLEKLKKLDAPMGLLTGNVEGLAWIKLDGANLKDFFDFGAFGNEAFKRVDLIEIARKKAEKILNKKLGANDFVIVGDTPKDIQIARKGGIKVIAVATGKYLFEELANEKPNLLLHTLLGQEQKIIDFLRRK